MLTSKWLEWIVNTPCPGYNQLLSTDKPTHVTNSRQSDCPRTVSMYSLVTQLVSRRPNTSTCLLTVCRQQETLDCIVTGWPQRPVNQLQPRHLPINNHHNHAHYEQPLLQLLMSCIFISTSSSVNMHEAITQYHFTVSYRPFNWSKPTMAYITHALLKSLKTISKKSLITGHMPTRPHWSLPIVQQDVANCPRGNHAKFTSSRANGLKVEIGGIKIWGFGRPAALYRRSGHVRSPIIRPNRFL